MELPGRQNGKNQLGLALRHASWRGQQHSHKLGPGDDAVGPSRPSGGKCPARIDPGIPRGRLAL